MAVGEFWQSPFPVLFTERPSTGGAGAASPRSPSSVSPTSLTGLCVCKWTEGQTPKGLSSDVVPQEQGKRETSFGSENTSQLHMPTDAT